MKTRDGFVSNSSSSSFVVIGVSGKRAREAYGVFANDPELFENPNLFTRYSNAYCDSWYVPGESYSEAPVLSPPDDPEFDEEADVVTDFGYLLLKGYEGDTSASAPFDLKKMQEINDTLEKCGISSEETRIVLTVIGG